jgi:iron complex outermembrane receptor protein
MANPIDRVRSLSLISPCCAREIYRRRARTQLTPALVLMAVALSQANAQSVNESSPQSVANTPGPLDEIVVTAQKRSQSVGDVPMSITALTGAELTALGVLSTEDLARVVPGFSTVTSYYGSPVYYLRGVGYYDTSVAARPAVTIYADEAPIPYSVMALGTMLDLERVEVLKGPQGTLFGSNSTGGAINFIAAKPTHTLETGADFSYGRFNDTILSAFVSGPLASSLDGRIALSHEGAGDWQRNYINGASLGAKDITSARATLEWQPLEQLRALLTLSGTYDGSDVQVGQLSGKNPAIPGQTPAFIAFPLAPAEAQATAFGTSYPNGAQLKKNNKEEQATLRLDLYATTNVTITSLTSFATNSQSYAQDAGATTLQVNALDRTGNVRSISEELRASGIFDEARGHWIFGGNFEHDKTFEDTIFGLADQSAGNVFDFLGLPPINEVPTILSTKYTASAVFGNLDFDALDTLTAHLGARYTDTRTSYSACTQNAGNLSYFTGIVTLLNLTGSSIAPIGAGDCAVFAPAPGGGYEPTIAAGSQDATSVSWRAGLDWKPVTGTMLYANASRGFKAAATSNIAAVFISQYQAVPQEELTSYEVGVKTSVVPLTHIDLAVFYYDYKDKQLQGTEDVPIFGPLQQLVSIPKSNIKGVDFDVTTKPVSAVTLRVQGTYLKSDVEGRFIGTTALGATANFGGNPFPNTPRWQTAAGAEYSWSIGGNLSMYTSAWVTYRSGTYGDFVSEPSLRIPSYTLLDACAGIRSDDHRWSAQLWGHNLTDRYYWTTQVANVEGIVRYAGLPATYGVSVSYRY